jgi:hypothetical protein
MTWKEELLKLRNDYYLSTYQAARDFGVPIAKPYKDQTANSLTRSIIDWITFSGYSATRINVQGQIRKKADGSFTCTPSTTRRGTADIHAIVKGKHISVEIKIGKDRMSTYQHEEKKRVEKAGGVYFIATDMESFVKFIKTV